jgi:parallel beta-helix repeat protein
MKAALIALLLTVTLALSAQAAPECREAFDGMMIAQDTVLCNKAFDVPGGITITAPGVTLDCNGAIIRGTGLQEGMGIIIDRVNGVTVKNCNILNYDAGIYIKRGNRNTVVHTALLKNKVGVRMLEAFENRFENNADKSTVKPVSALASKFNYISLTNKDLDRDFCEVNQCNDPRPMSPCAHDDGYCSLQCAHENDNDCGLPATEESPPITEYPALPNEPTLVPTPTPAPTKEPQMRITGETIKPPLAHLSDKGRFWAMTFLFIISYLIAFVLFQHHRKHH